MTEPQPTSDVGGAPVLGELPPPSLMDRDLPAEDLREKIARTDTALAAWREESVRRREAWEAQQAIEQQEKLAKSRRTLRWAVAGVAAAGLALGAGLWLAVAGGIGVATLARQAGPATAKLDPTPVEAAPVAAAPVAAAPVEEPVGEAVELAAAPVPEDEAPAADEGEVADVSSASAVDGATLPARAPVAGPVDVVAETVSLWSDRRHAWVSFVARDDGLVKMHWRDGAGNPVLEPMGCQATANADGARKCLAGRSHDRIRHAVSRGAAPGAWTVEACTDAGCTPVGTFDVP